MIITRFGPSPTGLLHLGSIRIALLNYFYSKKNNGKFILRIEDTDYKRSDSSFVKQIIEDLSWLGVKYDSIFYQSNNLSRYQEVAESLIKKGHAYFCICTRRGQEEYSESSTPPRCSCRELNLNNTQSSSIRFKVNINSSCHFKDTIYKDISVKNENTEDFVLLRGDGIATYNLAAAVDDNDMKISDIIRGSDHINNTLKQKMIFNAMGWVFPRSVHVPLFCDESGKKISKRDIHNMGIDHYREIGVFSDSIVKYLIGLGWDSDNYDSIETIVEKMNINKINPSPTKFSFAKIASINSKKITQTDSEIIYEKICNKLTENIRCRPGIIQLIDIIKKRSSTLDELIHHVHACYSYQGKDAICINKSQQEILKQLLTTIVDIKEFSPIQIKKSFDLFLTLFPKITKQELFTALRLAILGSSSSPDISLIMYFIGKEEILVRINNQIYRA